MNTTNEFLITVLTTSIQAGTCLVYATIGEILAERSGILNLGVEGMMLIGALTAFASAFYTQNLLIAVIFAMIAGGLMALIHALLSIKFRADQNVSGLALTIFATGLANFLGRYLGPSGTSLARQIAPHLDKMPIFGLAGLPIVGRIFFNHDILVYIMYLSVVVSWFYIYKTWPGLSLRATGENPGAADSLGINVFRQRYIYTIVGGMLAGVGGAHLSLSHSPGWSDSMTAGRGWIVIALTIFATWNPVRALFGAMLFGSLSILQFSVQTVSSRISGSILKMMPYILTILVLVTTTWWEGIRKHVGAPAALGVPYSREEQV